MDQQHNRGRLVPVDDGEIILLILAARDQRDELHQTLKRPWWRKYKLYTYSAIAVLAWLTLATIFYRNQNGWTMTKSFFHAIDIGFAVGTGTLVEGVGSPRSPDFVPNNKSMLFSIHHLIIGAWVVSGALAYFLSVMLERQDKMAVSAHWFVSGDETVVGRVVAFLRHHRGLVKTVLVSVVYAIVGAVVMARLTDGTTMQSLYFAVSAMSSVGAVGPDPEDPTQLTFAAFYTLVGVPLFAVLITQVSGLIVERWERKRQIKLLRASVSEGEFNYCDKLTNGTGDVPFSEFLVLMLTKLGKLDEETLTNIQKRFQALDVDGDGRFTKTEMHAMLQFEAYDRNDSGVLDPIEFALLLDDLDGAFPGIVYSTPERVLRQFREIDTDHDSVISKREFLEWWTAKQLQAQLRTEKPTDMDKARKQLIEEEVGMELENMSFSHVPLLDDDDDGDGEGEAEAEGAGDKQ